MSSLWAWFEFRWHNRFAMSLDRDTVIAFHDETLPAPDSGGLAAVRMDRG
ncbi:hypothetical protein H5392_05415 [Tessaracoccus sp. MC1865]|nr:hypothetical protein [Tessaracoccus sp. MC1865]MBB1483303.1 hypothetical protein [Tessaracoccus sp. MC1865]QTO37287.1 hypothetical protein J7D54_12795 [Tessaracoccus sp. MC1865]